MNGTEWTEPGQGATRRELVWAAPHDAELPPSFYEGITWERAYSERTNLRLTGAPLTADDLKRIAEAK